MCIIIMCNIELINKLCLYYIYSKEIRRLVITSNNAPVVKQLRVLASCAVDRGFDQRSDQTKNYTIYIGTWRKRIKAKTSQHNFFITWDRSHEVFHEYKLPCICPVYDIGFKVLSMKINYLAPFKHEHKHLKLVHENQLLDLSSLHGIGVMTCSMKINYLAPFKHKHKHQKFAHENQLPLIPSFHGP